MINILSKEQDKAIRHFKDKLNISLVNLNCLEISKMILRKGCIDLEVRPYLNIRSLKEGDVVDQPIWI